MTHHDVLDVATSYNDVTSSTVKPIQWQSHIHLSFWVCVQYRSTHWRIQTFILLLHFLNVLEGLSWLEGPCNATIWRREGQLSKLPCSKQLFSCRFAEKGTKRYSPWRGFCGRWEVFGVLHYITLKSKSMRSHGRIAVWFSCLYSYSWKYTLGVLLNPKRIRCSFLITVGLVF